MGVTRPRLSVCDGTTEADRAPSGVYHFCIRSLCCTLEEAQKLMFLYWCIHRRIIVITIIVADEWLLNVFGLNTINRNRRIIE